MPASRPLRISTLAFFRSRRVQAAAWRRAAIRQRSVVLLYHRVRPDGPLAHEVVPAIPTSVLSDQLEAVAEIGDIVRLDELLQADSRRRPRFAVTFDDDYRTHVEHALAVLGRCGVTATFFLSGRRAHGLGAYWWERLEALIARRGLEAAAGQLGVAAASPAALAALFEGSDGLAQLDELPAPASPPLAEEDIRTLVAGGHTIGFHTIRHPLLVGLAESEVVAHLGDGRAELQSIAGRTVDLLAYPHGRADEVAVGVARAAYRAAFTGSGRPIGHATDRHALGRWEPGPLDAPEFLASLAARLTLRGAGPDERGSRSGPAAEADDREDLSSP